MILEDESPDKQDKAPRKPDQAKSSKDPPTPTGRGPAAAVLPVRTDGGGAADARGLGAFPGSPVSALSEVCGLAHRSGMKLAARNRRGVADVRCLVPGGRTAAAHGQRRERAGGGCRRAPLLPCALPFSRQC